MAKLTLENVVKKFGRNVAVNGLSLEVKDGEFVVLLGPSGAGKTTTLKLVAGAETATAGKIYIGDRLVNAIEPHKRNVAMAFESYALYPHLKVYDNMAYPLRSPAYRKDRAYIDAKVKEVAELLNIHMLLDRLPRMLSNGQKQRVALGRALVRDPDILLLDEPISHLDAKLRHRMRTEFKALESSAIQTTTLYVTHDYLEALSLADRLAVIKEGQVVQIGTPYEVFNEPRNMFVANLMGHPQINLIPCSVQSSDGQLQLISEDGDICVDVPDKLRQQVEKANLSSATLGVRPMHLSDLNGGSAANVFGGKVYVYERLGTKGVLTMDVNGKHIDVITPIEKDFKIDETVRIAVNNEEIMIFDQNEQNILYSEG
ncbi:MAG: ABC transporter ATP-binding protein [Chloroflexota bacterium]